MKNLKLICSLLLLTLIFSCNPDDEDPFPVECNPAATSYYNFNTGTYWIYQWYQVDTLGNETIMENNIDTLRNVGDTLINGQTYVKQRGNYLSSQVNDYFKRDSAGYLVNERGDILFSATNFVDILNFQNYGDPDMPLFTGTFKMESDVLNTVETPAGSFECLNFQGSFEGTTSNLSWDNRTTDAYFAEGIGEVQSGTFYASSPGDLIRRLVEYQVE